MKGVLVQASLGKRIVATLIDLAIAGTVILSCPRPEGGLGVIVSILLWCAILTYFILGDSLMNGARLGKRTLGLRRVGYRHGGPVTIRQDLLRHLPMGSEWYLARMIDPEGMSESSPDETVVIDLNAGVKAEAEMQTRAVEPPREPVKLNLDGVCDYLNNGEDAEKE